LKTQYRNMHHGKQLGLLMALATAVGERP